MDIKSELFEFAFNVMTRMISGKNLNEAKIFREIANEISQLGKQANVLDFLPFMKWFGYGNVEKKLIELYRKRDQFMENAIEEYRRRRRIDHEEDGGRKESIIKVLLSLQETEPQNYTDEIIKGLLAVIIQELFLFSFFFFFSWA